eukprot:323895-Pyramimonas_sp.AAC.1
MGGLGEVLGASRAFLERREPEEPRTPKSLDNRWVINVSRPSWEGFWGSLGASRRPLQPSWDRLGRLGTTTGRLLGPSWT